MKGASGEAYVHSDSTEVENLRAHAPLSAQRPHGGLRRRAAAAHGEPMALPQSMESGEVLSPRVEEFQESRYWSSCCQADAHLGLAVASGHAFLKVSSGRWRRGHGLVR